MKSLWTDTTDGIPQLLVQRPAETTKRDTNSLRARAQKALSLSWTLLRTVFFQVALLLPSLWIAVVESELSDTTTHLKWDDERHKKSMHKEIRTSGEYSLESIRALAKSMSTPSSRCTVNDVLMRPSADAGSPEAPRCRARRSLSTRRRFAG